MARNYGIDLETLPEHLLANVDDDVAAQAKRTAQMFLRKNAGAMSLEAAMACDVAKQLWRRANPNIVNLWAKLEEAAISAVSNPGAVYSFGKIQYGVSGDFLKCRLPSGRFLHYYRPEFVSKPTDWGQDKVFIAFWSTNSVTRQWEKSRTNGLYGGICVQNAVQATARDLMAEAMLRLERAGYPVVLSVHDEIVAEVPEGTGSLKEFEAIMAQVPRWAEGCPIGAEGWVGRRYKK